MKTMAIILGILFFSGHLFAIEALIPNQSTAFDVLGKNPIVLDASKLGEIKEIKIQNEYSGFECFLDQVQSTKNIVGRKTIVSVSWSPGADISGCELEVSGTHGMASAALYMNY